MLFRSEASTLVADDSVVTRDSVLTSRDRQSVNIIIIVIIIIGTRIITYTTAFLEYKN